MEVVIFDNGEGGVSVFTPSTLIGKTLEQLAIEVVPTGVDFWIVDRSTLPPEDEYRDAWELDLDVLGLPDGQGGN